MDRLKTLARNKVVIRSLLAFGLVAAGAALTDDQVDKLTDVVMMILSLLG